MIMPIEEQYAITNEPFVMAIGAIDLDGDKITFADDTVLFDINAETGRIEFTPTNAQIGKHTIKVMAFDENSTAEASFVLNILRQNLPPTLELFTNSIVYAGNVLTIMSRGTDPENDQLVYSIDSNRFYFNGRSFAWQTSPSAIGDYNFTVRASDGSNLVQKTVQVTVVPCKQICWQKNTGAIAVTEVGR